MRMRPAAFAAIPAALLVLAACALPASTGSEDPGERPGPGATAEPTRTPTQTPEASSAAPDDDVDAEWQRFATDDGELAFSYPSDWTVEASSAGPIEGGPDRIFDDAVLTAPNGQRLLQAVDYPDLGGACGDGPRFPIEVLASEPAPGASGSSTETSIVAVALGAEDGAWRFGAGIMRTADVPEPGAEGCMLYFASDSSGGGVSVGTHLQLGSYAEDPLWTVATLDDARAYMDTGEYATILEILRSVEVG